MIAALVLAALVNYAPVPNNVPQPTADQTLIALHADLRPLVANYAPDGVEVDWKVCGTANAWYVPATHHITMCYELGTLFDQTIGYEKTVRALRFIAMHEIGHALFDLQGVPYVGNEELAADEYAAVQMIFMGEAADIDAVTDFFLIAGQDQEDDATDPHPTMHRRLMPLDCYYQGAVNPTDYPACQAKLYRTMGAWVRILED